MPEATLPWLSRSVLAISYTSFLVISLVHGILSNFLIPLSSNAWMRLSSSFFTVCFKIIYVATGCQAHGWPRYQTTLTLCIIYYFAPRASRLESLCSELEDNPKKGNSRVAFQIMKNLNTPYKPRTVVSKTMQVKSSQNQDRCVVGRRNTVRNYTIRNKKTCKLTFKRKNRHHGEKKSSVPC